MQFTEITAHYPPDVQPLTSKDVLERMAEISPDNRRLFWFLWDCSRQAGGYEAIASTLIKTFPERLQSKTMAERPNPPGGKYDTETALAIEEEVEGGASWTRQTTLTWDEYRRWPQFEGAYPSDEELHAEWTELTVPRIDRDKLPRIYWQDRCQALACAELAALVRESLLPDAKQREGKNSWEVASVSFPPRAPWFQNLPGALREYQRQRRDFISLNHYQTDIGKRVWDTLDAFLDSRRSCVIIGKPGTGKSQNLRAWCAAHAGEAVFFSTPSYGTQNEFFHRLGRTLGIPTFSGKSSAISRPWLERMLRESGLALVIDEAHFLLDRKDGAGRPPLINWIDSLTDDGVPVALCATPQFASDLKAIESKTGWALGQFTRRFADQWVVLPEATKIEDLERLAERLLPGAGTSAWKKAAIFASRRRDVSGLADLVRATREQAKESGRPEATQADFDRALKARFVHEGAIDSSFASAPRRGKGRIATTPEPEGSAAIVATVFPEASASPHRHLAQSGAQERPTAGPGAVAALGADIRKAQPERHNTTLPVVLSQPSRADFGAVNRPLNSPLLDRRGDSESELAADLDPTVAA